MVRTAAAGSRASGTSLVFSPRAPPRPLVPGVIAAGPTRPAVLVVLDDEEGCSRAASAAKSWAVPEASGPPLARKDSAVRTAAARDDGTTGSPFTVRSVTCQQGLRGQRFKWGHVVAAHLMLCDDDALRTRGCFQSLALRDAARHSAERVAGAARDGESRWSRG